MSYSIVTAWVMVPVGFSLNNAAAAVFCFVRRLSAIRIRDKHMPVMHAPYHVCHMGRHMNIE